MQLVKKLDAGCSLNCGSQYKLTPERKSPCYYSFIALTTVVCLLVLNEVILQNKKKYFKMNQNKMLTILRLMTKKHGQRP